MMFDFTHIPFSRFGRFLTISTMEGRSGCARSRAVICAPRLAGCAGSCFLMMPFGPCCRTCLTAATQQGRVEFVIGEGERLHLRGHGLTVTFALEGSRYDYAYVTPQGAQCVVSAADENTAFCQRSPGQCRGHWGMASRSCRQRGDDLFRRDRFRGHD
jgi:hypothetical protein